MNIIKNYCSKVYYGLIAIYLATNEALIFDW